MIGGTALSLQMRLSYFEDAEQEVVVLIGKKKDKEKECLIANCLYDNVDDFIRKYNQNDLIYEKILTNDKWTRYYLNEKENNVIEEIKQDSRFRKMGDVSLVNVGITTGNNDYFSLDDNSVKKYDFFEKSACIFENNLILYTSRVRQAAKTKYMRKCRNWQTSKTKDLVFIANVWVQVPSSASKDFFE